MVKNFDALHATSGADSDPGAQDRLRDELVRVSASHCRSEETLMHLLPRWPQRFATHIERHRCDVRQTSGRTLDSRSRVSISRFSSERYGMPMPYSHQRARILRSSSAGILFTGGKRRLPQSGFFQ